MKDENKIVLEPKSFNIILGRLEIKSLDGIACKSQIFFDGKLMDFIEEIDIHLSGSEIAPKITMKVEALNYTRYKKEKKSCAKKSKH